MVLRVILICLYISATLVSSVVYICLNANMSKKEKIRKVAEIVSSIPAYLLSAEVLYGCCAGEQKLQYVLDRLEERCKDLGVPFTSEEFKPIVETFLDQSGLKEI